MNVIFTCGGTAGHVNPALALAGYMQERHPERYSSLTTPTGPKDYSDGLACEPLDRMLMEQSWLCPILLKSGDRASYSPTLDRIVCPEKRQFPEGAAFYTTLLHEVTYPNFYIIPTNRAIA